MTEQRRSRRPSSARKPSAAARAGAGTEAPDGALQTLDDPEPSLGEVKFDEWFDTPVFESDSDERLEELATSRRGPLRLAASTFLRLNARADQMRRRTDQPDPSPVADPATDPLDQTLPAGPPEPAPAPRVTRAPRPRADGTGHQANGTAPRAELNATTVKVDGTPATPPEAAAPAAGGKPGLRQRFNAALDRWAEREAATQTRIERLLLPERWQG